jgi:hypothetical protein
VAAGKHAFVAPLASAADVIELATWPTSPDWC